LSDQYQFLDPWTLVLPDRPGCVLAVGGTGGKSTLLARLLAHYRGAGWKVLWTQSVPHPPPEGLAAADGDESLGRLRRLLAREGSIFIAKRPAPGASEWGGLHPDHIERLRQEIGPDVVLVEAQARSDTPLRIASPEPSWPRRLSLAFATAPLATVGRIWGPELVGGASEGPADSTDPRRIRSADVVGLLENSVLNPPCPARMIVPVLTGFGSFRNMDGMFEMVLRLWKHERVQLVLLAEFVGDPRRDAADLAALGPQRAEPAMFRGERVYALHPVRTDEAGGRNG
jgi:hypothetical protein